MLWRLLSDCLTSEYDYGPEGHDDHGDEEVGHRQRHQEVVRHVLKLPKQTTYSIMQSDRTSLKIDTFREALLLN